MNKEQVLHLEPYTASTLTSFNEGENFLENILSAGLELQPRKVDKPIHARTFFKPLEKQYLVEAVKVFKDLLSKYI